MTEEEKERRYPVRGRSGTTEALARRLPDEERADEERAWCVPC